jgi:hypothetical protein
MVSIPLARTPIRRRKLRPATPALRLAATLINLLAAPAALALTLGAGVLVYRRPIPMPWSALSQSTVDWLSGTAVVVDRHHRPRARPR